MGKSKIVIGDVHGQYDALKALINKFPKAFPKEDICFSGDLIDRGPEPRKVVEYVMENGFDMCLGNHEDFMVTEDSYWLLPQNGGQATAYDYDTDKLDKLEELKIFMGHKAWMKNLPLYLEYKDVVDAEGRHLVVSHSSAAKTWKYRDSTQGNHQWFRDNVLWGRDMNPRPIPEVFNVFGHTVQKNKARVGKHFACVDGGGYVTWEKGYGKLYAIQFPEMIVYEQEVDNTSHEDRLRKAGIL